jgi:hypothetical protein
MADISAARAAKERLRSELAQRPHIRGVGVGLGPDGYCVRVNVAADADRVGLPRSVDGVPVDVRVVGRVSAQR